MNVLDVLVWIGTITFAVTGALVAVRKRFDLVGVLILGSVTAIGGGSIRDLMAGIIPPGSLTDESLLWVIALTCLAVFFGHRWIPKGVSLYALDTLGLAVFAALGAERALSLGFGFWGTVFAGVLSGVGGGIIRDVLSGEVPGVLYRSGDLYASAAGAGAAVLYLLGGGLQSFAVSGEAALLAAVVVVGGLRVGSRMAGLEFPVPRVREGT